MSVLVDISSSLGAEFGHLNDVEWPVFQPRSMLSSGRALQETQWRAKSDLKE